MVSGGDVLQKRGLHEGQRWTDIQILLGFFVLYRVLCLMVLTRRVSKSKVFAEGTRDTRCRVSADWSWEPDPTSCVTGPFRKQNDAQGIEIVREEREESKIVTTLNMCILIREVWLSGGEVEGVTKKLE
ncbi:hypothetical protein DVH24_024828 [Malus domestica]|uniref:Uncharacterized protein n=1 Tax=Malus domestica TaxID=3750 RepID=A0A498JMQ2_MALDO|nr:hypothetical protein DVH24_024828 [Malus domestica]